jgi:sRNA-binding regulator protein Hfq
LWRNLKLRGNEDMGKETELLELAKKEFGKLSEAEVKFFTAMANGKVADYQRGDEEFDKPENADKWGEDRSIKAGRIRWLCTDKNVSKFITHKGIQVSGLRVEGSLDLAFANLDFPFAFISCVFKGVINLQYSTVKLLCLDGTHTVGITADGLRVEGSVLLRNGFKAEGEVNLLGAEIGRDLECQKSEFINSKGKALNADRLKVKGAVFLSDGFRAEGEMDLLGAEIGGNLECEKSEFINPEGKALNADRLKVKGGVFLRNGFKAKGEVNLLGAEIGVNLECDKSEFINSKGKALAANRLKVKGSVFLRDGFKAEGEVNLLGAEIGRDLDCEKSELVNPKENALTAAGLTIKGGVYLRNGFKAEGRIDLMGAIINGYLIYTGVKSPEKAKLDLRSAKIGTLYDEKKSWPKKGNLYLHGTVYDDIFHKSPRDAKSRIEWLRLNGGEGFSPQPYEQLAEVLKREGHEEDAKEVLIAKNKDYIKSNPKSGILKRARYWLFGLTMGYGYKPLNMLWVMFLFLLIGWIVFGVGAKYELITPTQGWAYEADDAGKLALEDEYPAFNFWVYSIDTFIPLVDLQQGKYWLPNANKGKTRYCFFEWIDNSSGGWLRIYLWVHIAFGWILTTLLVVGLTGLVRK